MKTLILLTILALFCGYCSAQLIFCKKNADCETYNMVCEQEVCQRCDKKGCRVIAWLKHKRDVPTTIEVDKRETNKIKKDRRPLFRGPRIFPKH